MYNIYCQWHPLKTCIVGRTYHPEFFQHTPAADKLAKVCEETEEDLQSIVSILKEFNVNVIRPQLDINDRFENYIRQSIPRPPIAPRDAFVVIGNTVFEFGDDHPSIKDCINQETKRSVFSPSREPLYLPAPSITQLGKDILLDVQCFNPWEIQWIKKKLPNNRINKISVGGHNDGSFIILKPGVVISLAETIDWKAHFPGWQVLEVNNDKHAYCKQWLTDSRINQGRWWIPGQEDDTELAAFVDQWLSKWTGYAAETVFSINALIIDEKHVIINTARKDVIDFLKSNGIEAIVCPQRHQYFWDNGIHCMTLDLSREGDTFDLFPSHTSPFICKGF
jgi:hypothetical protein